MSREEAEKLVSDLLDLCVEYERAESWQVKYIINNYRAAKKKVIVALIGKTEIGA